MVDLEGRKGRLCHWFILAGAGISIGLAGCRSSADHREQADAAAMGIIREQQAEGLGRIEPFTIERPEETFRKRLLLDQHLPQLGPSSLGTEELAEPPHWPAVGEAPEKPIPFFPAPADEDGVISLDLIDSLRIAAENSRDYQEQKEALFLTALELDLERFAFDTTFTGFLSAFFSSDQDINETGVEGTGELGVQRTFETGASLSGRLILDLVRLLTGDGDDSVGLLGDASITVPLMRGSGRHIVTEPRTQAERNVLYALFAFEEFKRTYAVRVAEEFYSVLQNRDQIANAEANYNRLVLLVERTEAFHDRGRVTGIEVDQARQDLLRAREEWISARDRYAAQLDRFKLTLGLPTDARIELEENELVELAAQAEAILGEVGDSAEKEPEANELELDREATGRGRYEIDEDEAIDLAWANRLDLRIAEGQVYDAQRKVIVAADLLRPGLNVVGRATLGERRTIGSAAAANARLEPADGFYFLGTELDLPWSRRAERLAYRESLIRLESAVRDVQEIEDAVKLDVRDGLRNLLQQRENYQIQVQALNIAERRMRQAQAFQEAGRAETRDVLEANEALIEAQNSLVDAVVSYRVTELAFQRDLGLLVVDERGLWEEYNPAEAREEGPNKEE